MRWPRRPVSRRWSRLVAKCGEQRVDGCVAVDVIAEHGDQQLQTLQGAEYQQCEPGRLDILAQLPALLRSLREADRGVDDTPVAGVSVSLFPIAVASAACRLRIMPSRAPSER